LILGLEDSGKSLLIRRLHQQPKDHQTDALHLETNPTVGFDTNTITLKGREYYVNEVGSAMIGNWYKFLADTKLVLFVVDLSNSSQLAAAMVEFNLLLEKVKGKEVFLVFNKVDVVPNYEREFIHEAFNLDEKRKPGFEYEFISAAKGTNVGNVVKWLESNLAQEGEKKKKFCCI